MKVTEQEYLLLSNKAKIWAILQSMDSINNLPKDLEDMFADAFNNIESIHTALFEKIDITDDKPD